MQRTIDLGPDPDARLARLCDTLEMLANHCEWEALEPAVAEFSTLIAGLDPNDGAAVARMELAREVVARILPSALAARTALEAEIRQLGKGRKAVAAYR